MSLICQKYVTIIHQSACSLAMQNYFLLKCVVQFTASEYGLFLSDEDKKQGVWLDSGRNLGYYFLRNHDVLEYRRKLRTLRVRMLDGAVKTILVDDSQPVSQLMVVICTKIGITNHEEYGLVREENDQQNENLPDNKTGTLTLRRKFAEKDRDAKMESLRKKLKTDDESKLNCAPNISISLSSRLTLNNVHEFTSLFYSRLG